MKKLSIAVLLFFFSSVCFGQRFKTQSQAGLVCVATPSVVKAGDSVQLSMTASQTTYSQHFEWFGPHLVYGTDSSKPTVDTKNMAAGTYTYYGQRVEIDKYSHTGNLQTITRCRTQIEVQ